MREGAAEELLSYADPQGYYPLREAIARYLHQARGINTDADHVLITDGTQSSLTSIIDAIFDVGDDICVEDPLYNGARLAFESAGLGLAPISVDGYGIDVDAAQRAHSDVKAVYVTPSHQYPLGVTMSIGRRLALIAWSTQTPGPWIIEDDYDGDVQYVGQPLAAFKSLDLTARVIYVGTLSKTLFPSLRVGYVVMPDILIDAFRAIRRVRTLAAPTLMQAVTADFFNDGHFARHLRFCEILKRDGSQDASKAPRRLTPDTLI